MATKTQKPKSLPRGWEVAITKKGIQITFSGKGNVAADSESLEVLFEKLKTKPVDREAVKKEYNKKLRERAKNASGPAKEPIEPKKNYKVAPIIAKEKPQSSSGSSMLKAQFEGKTIAEMSITELKIAAGKCGLATNMGLRQTKDSLIDALTHHVRPFPVKTPKSKPSETLTAPISTALNINVGGGGSSGSSSSSVVSLANLEVAPEPQSLIATKMNFGSKGRRKYIDYDEKTSKRSRDTEEDDEKPNRKARMTASIDGLDGGAMQLFAGENRGSKGIMKAMRKHSKRPSIMPTHLEVQKFPLYVSKCDPYVQERSNFNKSKSTALYKEWLWQTQLDFNILVYGVGDKTDVLLNFHKLCLHDEDCVGIDGWPDKSASFSPWLTQRTPEENFRCLLDMIWVDIIGKSLMELDSHSQDSLDRYLEEVLVGIYEHYKLTSKELHGLARRMDTDVGVKRGDDEIAYRLQEFRQHRLYILVFGIDGPLLASPTTIELLSKLSSCRIVSVIATVSHINAPLLWSHDSLTRFRWSYHAFSSFNCSEISTEFEKDYITNVRTSSSRNAGDSDYTKLEYILQSMPQKLREIIMHIADTEIKRREFFESKTTKAKDHHKDDIDEATLGANNQIWNSKGILVDGLFDICRSKLLIQHVQFQKDLRELKEQNIISFSSFGANQDGRQYFSVPLHTSVLMSLVGSKTSQSKTSTN